MTSTDKLREFIIDAIRDGYDRAPDDYKPGDSWDDGAGRIAEAIISGPIAELVDAAREEAVANDLSADALEAAHKLLAEAEEALESFARRFYNDRDAEHARAVLARIREVR